MKTKEEVLEDVRTSSKRMKPFYLECSRIVEQYDHDSLFFMGLRLKKNIDIYVKRRKNDKSIYTWELKKDRRFLRWIKYLLNERKVQKIKPANNVRHTSEQYRKARTTEETDRC